MPNKPDPTPYDTLEQSAERIGFKLNIPPEYADRKASDEEQWLAEQAAAPKPVKIVVVSDDIARMYAEHYSPYMFNQALLERFKAAGAPVSGVFNLKLMHGAIARVKAEGPQAYFEYIWLPEQHVRMIASAGRN